VGRDAKPQWQKYILSNIDNDLQGLRADAANPQRSAKLACFWGVAFLRF
jgi:hypothetical protein